MSSIHRTCDRCRVRWSAHPADPATQCPVCAALGPEHQSRIARIAGRVSGAARAEHGGEGVPRGSGLRSRIPRAAWIWISDLVARAAAAAAESAEHPPAEVVEAFWAGYDETANLR